MMFVLSLGMLLCLLTEACSSTGTAKLGLFWKFSLWASEEPSINERERQRQKKDNMVI